MNTGGRGLDAVCDWLKPTHLTAKFMMELMVCRLFAGGGESAANPSLNRRSDEFLESIKKGSKRQSACRLFLVIKINFTQF